MSSGRGASSCTAAIAAWSWYGPSGACSSASRDQRDALRDQRLVPVAAVLLVERYERAVGARALAAPGVGQEHQREETGDLTVVGKQLVHRPGQADRFGGEIGT